MQNITQTMPLASHKGALAVAAVIDIALHCQTRPVSAKALAARNGLTPRHLEPVLQALVHAGILRSVRGPNGGYQIARDRREISADDVIRVAETSESGSSTAKMVTPILANVIIPVFAQAEQAFSAVLTKISIDDLVRLAGTLI